MIQSSRKKRRAPEANEKKDQLSVSVIRPAAVEDQTKKDRPTKKVCY